LPVVCAWRVWNASMSMSRMAGGIGPIVHRERAPCRVSDDRFLPSIASCVSVGAASFYGSPSERTGPHVLSASRNLTKCRRSVGCANGMPTPVEACRRGGTQEYFAAPSQPRQDGASLADRSSRRSDESQFSYYNAEWMKEWGEATALCSDV
jgi:hypothetical protein